MGQLENLRGAIDQYVQNPSPAAAADLARRLEDLEPRRNDGAPFPRITDMPFPLSGGNRERLYAMALTLTDDLVAALDYLPYVEGSDLDRNLAHQSARDFRRALGQGARKAPRWWSRPVGSQLIRYGPTSPAGQVSRWRAQPP